MVIRYRRLALPRWGLCTLRTLLIHRVGFARREHGEPHRKFCALAGLAGDADVPAVGQHDLPRDEEAQAQPAVVPDRRGPLEALEDPLRVPRREADAFVLHL